MCEIENERERERERERDHPSQGPSRIAHLCEGFVQLKIYKHVFFQI